MGKDVLPHTPDEIYRIQIGITASILLTNWYHPTDSGGELVQEIPLLVEPTPEEAEQSLMDLARRIRSGLIVSSEQVARSVRDVGGSISFGGPCTPGIGEAAFQVVSALEERGKRRITVIDDSASQSLNGSGTGPLAY